MNDFFVKLKANLELDPTLAGVISTRHNAIREYLKNNHVATPDSKLIGSHQRNTRIRPSNGQSIDIDIIVVLGSFYSWVSGGGVTPSAAMQSVHAVVSTSPRYGDMYPVQDQPTIALAASNGVKVELVPAYVDEVGVDPAGNFLGSKGRGYWVAKDGRWVMADYDHEAGYMTQQNVLSNGWLIPAIKMLKAIKRIYFPQLGSFSLEILAALIIPPVTLARTLLSPPVTYPELLLAFFDQAPRLLSSPIQVPGSKSSPMVLDQATQQSISTRFRDIAGFIRATQSQPTQAAQVDYWRRLFGDAFPARI